MSRGVWDRCRAGQRKSKKSQTKRVKREKREKDGVCLRVGDVARLCYSPLTFFLIELFVVLNT